MKNVSLFYYNEIPNFGDELNISILKKIFNIDPIKGRFYNAELVMIGSLLQSFLYEKIDYKTLRQKHKNPPLHIFGTGFIKPPTYKNEKFRRKPIINALRGELSKKRFETILKRSLGNIPLGDPGLLSSMLVEGKKEKKYSVGIIPHYVDKENDSIKKLADKIPDATIINIQDDCDPFLNNISECHTVISSAMHGLIAADSLGIPNIRMILSDKISGGDYKYNDYYSALDVANPRKIDFHNYNDIIDMKGIPGFIEDSYCINPDKVEEVRENLIQAFPKNLLDK